MNEQDKPFICYKSRWNFKIVPRNATGWLALAWWLLALAPPTAGYVWLMSRQPSDTAVSAWTIGFVVIALVWGLAMLRWTYLRSEVIDLDELLKLKHERDRGTGRTRS